MKNQKGITLMSLIITIIVMMILAGIALSFSVGENGVITKAEETKTVQSNSEELERVALVILNAKTLNLSSLNGDPEFDEGLIKKAIEKEFGMDSCDVEKVSDYFVVTIKDTNNKYKVTVDGKVEKMDENEENGNQEPSVGEGGTIIPEGGIYTTASGEVCNAGENFPEKVTEGDIYEYDDYKYTYRTCWFDGDWFDKETYEEDFETPLEGWSVITIDKTKSEYGEILSSVNGQNVTNLVSTFWGCESLEIAPSIPNTVIDLFSTFYDCKKLEQSPSIPNGVINMNSTFSDCVSLIKAPIIPENVINMGGTFYGCTLLTNVPNIPSKVTDMGITFYYCESLTTVPAIPSMVDMMEETFNGCKMLEGEIEINANPSETKGCFNGTKKSIILTGTASNETKERLKNTSSGNITWK